MNMYTCSLLPMGWPVNKVCKPILGITTTSGGTKVWKMKSPARSTIVSSKRRSHETEKNRCLRRALAAQAGYG